MFVRRKKNKCGITSVQVIDKSGWKYKLAKPIGSSAASVIESLVEEAELWIRKRS